MTALQLPGSTPTPSPDAQTPLATNAPADGAQTNQQATAAAPVNIYPSVDQIMQVCPDSSRENVEKYAPYILKAMCGANMTSANQLIGVVATIYVETTPWAPIPEYGRGAGKSYGTTFYGRGFVQLTWEENYRRAESELGISGLVANPDIALEPEIAARLMMWYFNGGTGNQSIVPYAEQGDFQNVRSIVNAGSPGRWARLKPESRAVFQGAVDRGKQVFTQPLDPAAINALPIDGSYALGCADPGSGGNRTLTSLNPQSQNSALAYALGLTARAMSRALQFRGYLDAAAEPKLLDLDAQKVFELKGVAEDLDGKYTVEDVVYTLGEDGLEVEINAYQPDPNAPAPTAFPHAFPGTGPLPAPGTTPAPAPGDIPGRIFEKAKAAQAIPADTSVSGAICEYGNLACAWAVNTLCVEPAGLAKLGGEGFRAVVNCTNDLEGGRGQKIDRASAVPGDIWVSPGQKHIGIVMTAGATRVLSNSSSSARFKWEDDIDDVNGYYGGGPEHGIYRVLN